MRCFQYLRVRKRAVVFVLEVSWEVAMAVVEVVVPFKLQADDLSKYITRI